MKKTGHIIIIGGGAAGLYAARELLRQQFTVSILEARERLGGRIHTIHAANFSQPVELGVEFIHGRLPLTLALLNEAGIQHVPAGGEMVRVEGEELKSQDDFAIDWSEVMKKMNEVREDQTMDEFLDQHFKGEKYLEVRKSVVRFAQGFDLADTSKASLLSLREEWMGENDQQFRIPGGFDQLIAFLEQECTRLGGEIFTSAEVVKVEWKKNEVLVYTAQKLFAGSKAIITLPIGQIQRSTLSFIPQISQHIQAANEIGFGTVVKILFEFTEAFWKKKRKRAGFFLSNEIIPTWWTQFPSDFPLLTGWAGGPQAWPLAEKSNDEIVELGLQSLSAIFQQPVGTLQNMLKASAVANWKQDRFTNGAYSYHLVGSSAALNILNKPLEDTLHFAGEGFYEGPSPGTVEAALVSARLVADEIIKHS